MMLRQQYIAAVRLLWSIEPTGGRVHPDETAASPLEAARPSSLQWCCALLRRAGRPPFDVDFLVHRCVLPIASDLDADPDDRDRAFALFAQLAPFARRAFDEAKDGTRLFAWDQVMYQVDLWSSAYRPRSPHCALWRAMLLVDKLLAGAGSAGEAAQFHELNGTSVGTRHHLRGAGALVRVGWASGYLSAVEESVVDESYFVLGLDVLASLPAPARAARPGADVAVHWRPQFSRREETTGARDAFAPLVVRGKLFALTDSKDAGVVEVPVLIASGGAGAATTSTVLHLPVRLEKGEYSQLAAQSRAPLVGRPVTALLRAGPAPRSLVPHGFMVWLRDVQADEDETGVRNVVDAPDEQSEC
jgi:hypothetical protein